MAKASNKLSFDLWIEAEYYMTEREFSKLSKQQRNDIRSEYEQYMNSEAD